jgi:predicted  nucleic acid-binding Zn-ribbon protein
MTPSRLLRLAPLSLALLAGCSSMYYSTMESFGYEKRDILADRVQDGRDEQQEAAEQFQSALEAFKAVAEFDGGKLQTAYDDLSKEYERCADQADDVRSRIGKIEDVAEDLFVEWGEEIGAYSDANLKAQSESMRQDTMGRYEDLIGAMRKAESKMDPVLVKFKDQVMFLKHNLNAQAIAALQNNVIVIESDVSALVAEMEASIAEADAFIATLG